MLAWEAGSIAQCETERRFLRWRCTAERFFLLLRALHFWVLAGAADEVDADAAATAVAMLTDVLGVTIASALDGGGGGGAAEEVDTVELKEGGGGGAAEEVGTTELEEGGGGGGAAEVVCAGAGSDEEAEVEDEGALLLEA